MSAEITESAKDHPRRVSIPIKWLAPAIMLVILSPIFAMLAAVKISNNNAKHLQEQYIADRARTQEASRIAICSLFDSMIDAYDEVPPTTSAKKIQNAWIGLYTISQCQPPRTK